ncbi:hypothetical protein N9T98_00060 [bacterium]|nr:hypothetical protein [bacterium]
MSFIKKNLLALAPLALLALLPGSAKAELKIELPSNYCNLGLHPTMFQDCLRQKDILNEKLDNIRVLLQMNQSYTGAVERMVKEND